MQVGWRVNTFFLSLCLFLSVCSGLLSLGVPGVPWHTQILADQLTLFQPRGTDYAHLITTGTPGFSDLPTALAGFVRISCEIFSNFPFC